MRSGLLALLLTLPLTAACDVLGGGPSPDATVAALETALAAKNLDGVPLQGDGERAKQTGEVLAGLEEYDVAVEAGDIETDDDRATVPLTWTWDLGDDDWSYRTEAALVLDGETWRLDWSPAVLEPSLADGEVLELTTLQARRGDILGAGDAPIVTNRPVVRFGIDKTKVGSQRAPESARRLAALLDIDPAAYARKVKQAGAKAFVEALVLREADAAAVDVTGIPGAAGLGTEIPLAPTREFAAPILGTVGEATAEIVAESDGRVQPGDQVGRSGLQQRYDASLAGVDGLQVQAVAEGGEARVLFQADERNGEPLRTTLDLRLQALAERTLAAVGSAIVGSASVGSASALVAIQPSTGRILAAASGPGSAGYNTATFAQYAPGSTFKVVTALALLRSGLTPDSPVDCPPSVNVDGKRFENYDDYPAGSLGRITLREAIAQSCNTALIGQRDRLSGTALEDAAAALGLGVDHDLGFPAYFGAVDEPQSETGAAANMIGQGTVLASPMAMATVLASVVRGETVLPVLLTEHDVEQVTLAQPLTAKEARALRTLLHAVVTEGSGAGLADVPGVAVAKTGTAEFERDGQVATHAWMIASKGDLAVAVFVEVGESGSRTAGPLLEGFLRGA
jgi:cell division protein FtsI/penicillin-binding protein 2